MYMQINEMNSHKSSTAVRILVMSPETHKIWKSELYCIQLAAPSPLPIICENEVDTPTFFSSEYHGILSHKDASLLLDNQPNGAYLVRKGNDNNDFYTLTWKFEKKIHHYKLYYDGQYYVKDKKYESIQQLTADGLLQLHMTTHASHIIQLMHTKATYHHSPYVTLNRRKLRALSDRTKRRKLLEGTTKKESTNSLENSSSDLNIEALVISSNSVTSPTTDNNILLEKFNKDHSFKVHNFKGLNWCEFCANFLWGFTAQGVKCEDCGFIAHLKCSKNVPSHCMPDLKKIRGVFGIDLTTLLNAHSSTLPFVVKKCITEIESRGMEQEGIYRISGFADEIEALKMALDKDGEAANLSEYSNVNVVAGCLKLYLRLLPIPLLTFQIHPKLVAATYLNNETEQSSLLREALTLLPPAHYNTVQYVIQHLHRVSLKATENKMSAYNLSTVFAPTLMVIPANCTDLSEEINALELLIRLAPKIFGT